MAIPRIIIQTARSCDLPPLARAAAANLRLLHPGWEFQFFDDDAVKRFIVSEFPQYRSIFDAFPYKIQRFDFFRYLAVYRFGGFYFDLDVFLWRALDDLLSLNAVFPFEELTLNRFLREEHNIDWEIGNYAFAAGPGNSFLEQVIEGCVRGQRDDSWVQRMMRGIPRPFRSDFEVLNSTGPGLLTRTLSESRRAARELTVLFPENVCDCDLWHRFGDYGVHAMEGSWRTKGSFIRRRLACLWEARERARYLEASRKLGTSRNFPARESVDRPAESTEGFPQLAPN